MQTSSIALLTDLMNIMINYSSYNVLLFLNSKKTISNKTLVGDSMLLVSSFVSYGYPTTCNLNKKVLPDCNA